MFYGTFAAPCRQTFTHFSALGARATWAALDTFDDENAEEERLNPT